MAGGVSRSNKELWVLISGASVLKSQELVGTELEKNSTKLLEGISYYKKPSTQSAQTLSKDKSINGAQLEFIGKLSKFLDLDEIQCYDIFCSYLLFEYKGSQKGLWNALSHERLVQSLMLQIWNYYYCERLYLLLCMKEVVGNWFDSEHPYQKLYEQFFENVNQGHTVIRNVITQFESACSYSLPVKETHGSLMNETQAFRWITFNLKEQCELLQIMLLYYKDMACKSDVFCQLLTIFQKHGFGRRQNCKNMLDDSNEILLDTIRALEALVIIENMELEWLVKCKDTDNKGEYLHFMESEDTWKKIDNMLTSMGSTVEQSPIVLSWMVVRFVVAPESNDTVTQRLGKNALRHDVFNYLRRMLNIPIFSGSSAVAYLAHVVIYGLITNLLSMFELNTFGKIEDLQLVAELVLRHANIANDMWEQGLDSGIGILLRHSMEWFPYDFHSFLRLISAVASSGQCHEQILSLVQNLSYYTEAIDQVEKTAKIIPGEEENTWQLVTNHLPYNSDTFVILNGTMGVLIQEEKEGGCVIQWHTKVNGWQVCLCEIYVLMQQMSHGVGHTSDEVLRKIYDVASLVYSLVNSSFRTANQLCHIIDMMHAILPRFCTLPSPPMELLAKCVDVFGCIAEEKAVEVWKCLSQAGFMPFFNKVNPNLTKLASGIDMNVGTIGNIIAAQECVTGNYHLTLAFLNMMNKSVETMVQEDDGNFLAAELFLLNEVFSFFHKWRYRQQKDREMIGKGCLNVIHKLLNLCWQGRIETEGTLAQKLCIHSLLYTSSGQALLLIVGTGEENIQITLEQQTSWSSCYSNDLIELVRLSLSVLNRLLLLKSCVTQDSKEVSPMERTLCSPPIHHKQPHIVLVVTNYGFHRFDPRLATLAVQLLKRFAKELSISVLACLGNDAEAIRDIYLTRLEAATEDVRLKIALLEFLSVCVASQPGLLEMFLNIPKSYNSSQELSKDQPSCLNSVMDILKERHEAIHFCPVELHRAAVEFLHALWVGWRNIAIYVLKKNPSFWCWLCESLQEDCKTGKNIQIAAYVMKILALEFYYNNSLQSETSDPELVTVVKKVTSGTCMTYWSRTVKEVLSTTEKMDITLINTSLSPMPESQRDTIMLMTAWREFLAITAKHKAFPLNDEQKTSLTQEMMESLLEESLEPISPKILSVLSELVLLLLHSWKSDCIGDWENWIKLIDDLLERISANQEQVTTRSVLSAVSLATYFLQLMPQTTLEQIDCSIFGGWVTSTCVIIQSLSVNMKQMMQQGVHSVHHQLPMACVSLLKELLERLTAPSLWLPSLLLHSTVPCLKGIMATCMQLQTGTDLVSAILVFYLTVALHPESIQVLSSNDVVQQLCLPLSFTYSNFQQTVELPTNHINMTSKPRSSPWLDVYETAVKFVMTMLKMQKHFFLEDALNFVGVHLDRLLLSLMQVRISLDIDDLNSALIVLNFVNLLSSYQQSWKLQHHTSFKSLLESVCAVCQASVAFLIRPNFIQHLLEHQPKTESGQMYLEEERQRIRRLSSTEDIDKLSPQLVLIQTKLLEIVSVSLSTLRHFTPDICEILLDQCVDASHWEPVLHCSFSTPNIDQDSPMNFGTMVSCVNVCLRTLTKNEQMPSPGRSSTNEVNSQVDRALLLFVLENSLMMLTSQALLYLVLPQPTSRDKQLIKRELGAELNSFSLSMNRYLRRGTTAIQSPATSALTSPGQSRAPQLWSAAGTTLAPGNQPFVRLIISLVDKIFK